MRLAISRPWPWLAAALCVVTVGFSAIPFLAEMPHYLADARLLAFGARLSKTNLTPVGYPLLLSPFLKVAGIGGVIAVQSAAYVATVLVAWISIRRGSDTRSRRFEWVGPACLAGIILHPYLVIDTHRINDNAFNVLAIAVLALWRFDRFLLASLLRSVAYGGVIGIFTAIRPNALIFAAMPLVAAVCEPGSSDRRRTLALSLPFFATAVFSYGMVAWAATGDFWFWPSNGPYNFFAGNNPLTFSSLIDAYNAEPSIGPALAAAGFAPSIDPSQVSPQIYMKLAWSFIEGHVLGFVALCLTKLLVLFAPRTVHSQSAASALLQVVLSLPVFLWAAALVRARRVGTLGEARLGIVFVLLYVLPMLVTNADSRLRVPLDIWFLLDIAAIWQRPSRAEAGTVLMSGAH